MKSTARPLGGRSQSDKERHVAHVVAPTCRLPTRWSSLGVWISRKSPSPPSRHTHRPPDAYLCRRTANPGGPLEPSPSSPPPQTSVCPSSASDTLSQRG